MVLSFGTFDIRGSEALLWEGTAGLLAFLFVVCILIWNSLDWLQLWPLGKRFIISLFKFCRNINR